ncbi:sensor histidine kinase [Sinomicrobium sp. M5D2P9]
MMIFNPYESLLIITSVLGTTFCFNLVLYFGYHKRAAYLFFAFYCLFHIFKIYLKIFPEEEKLIPFIPLTTTDYIYLSVLLGMASLNIFLLYHFALPYKKHIVILLMGTSAISFFILKENVYIFMSLGGALLLTLWARNNNRETGIVLCGVIVFSICVILRVSGYMPYGYFIGIIFFIFCMFLSVGIELSRQQKEHRQVLLRSSRLENQLLKKSIQPHFLFNSLTSLQELMETDPVKAGVFLEDISGEFELFSEISHKKQIPVKDELKLVRHYLGIMAVRKNVVFALNTKNLDEEKSIPPGVFLTLVENGITHGYENRNSGNFTISEERGVNYRQYVISNDGTGDDIIKEKGMGIQYVISRLEESYGKKFDFSSYPCPGGWMSVIKIFL